MTFSRIRELLEQLGVSPSKTLGQNFLTDANIARSIVDSLDPQPDDCIVEIGPGLGSLTEHLVGRCRRVILVEFDARLADYQRARWKDEPSVEVHCADAARLDPRFLYAERPVKLLGNLPYSAGGAIMANLLGHPSPFCLAVIMLQRELVERILAAPGGKDWGLFSLRIQIGWDGKLVRLVPPGVFYPQPKIDSAVMLLSPKDEMAFPPFDHRLLDELARRGFACRRKQLHKQLPSAPAWSEIAEKLGVPTTVRAEQLSLLQWVELSRAYDTNPLADLPQRGDELFDVVDEHNRVIRQATRDAVHEQGLMHRAVHILVFTPKGDCLLQKRSMRKDRQPGVWDSSAAGHLDAGEDYLHAAVRELEEELGVRAEKEQLELLAMIPASPDTGMEHVALYALRNFTGKPRFPAAEISAVLPFPIEVIDAWLARQPNDFAPSFALCWRTQVSRENRRWSAND